MAQNQNNPKFIKTGNRLLQESMEKRGGMKPPPLTPKPDIIPPTQNKKAANK